MHGGSSLRPHSLLFPKTRAGRSSSAAFLWKPQYPRCHSKVKRAATQGQMASLPAPSSPRQRGEGFVGGEMEARFRGAGQSRQGKRECSG